MEFYITAAKYLRNCGIRISKTFIRSRMQSHPDYPALVALTDTLDEMGLSYSAVIADKDKYPELQYPLLVHVKQQTKKDDFVVVDAASAFVKDGAVLLERWNGISVMVPTRQLIKHEEHNKLQQQEKRTQIRLFLTGGGVIAMLFSSLFYRFDLTLLLLLLLSVLGWGVCCLIVLHSMGKSNALTEQLCASNGNSGCDKVLHSGMAAVWKDVNLGDIGLMYFSANAFFLALVNSRNSVADILATLFIPYMLAAVLSGVSAWYQWKVVKQWCKMCLMVAGIVLAQSAVILVAAPALRWPPLDSVVFLLFTVLVPAMIWFGVKPLVETAQASEEESIDFLKWKRNSDIFLPVLYNQRKVDTIPWHDDIVLGNPRADLQMLMVCSPYCNPCGKAHKQIEKLLSDYENSLGITVRFGLMNADVNDKKVLAVMHIAEACRSLGTKKQIEVLDDWFEYMDLDKFRTKYPTDLVYGKWNGFLQKSVSWSAESKITHTPTLFINGFEKPASYAIADCNQMINQLLEKIAPYPTVANVV